MPMWHDDVVLHNFNNFVHHQNNQIFKIRFVSYIYVCFLYQNNVSLFFKSLCSIMWLYMFINLFFVPKNLHVFYIFNDIVRDISLSYMFSTLQHVDLWTKKHCIGRSDIYNKSTSLRHSYMYINILPHL